MIAAASEAKPLRPGAATVSWDHACMMVTGWGVKGVRRSPYKRAAGEENFWPKAPFPAILAVFEQVCHDGQAQHHGEMTPVLPLMSPYVAPQHPIVPPNFTRFFQV